MDVLGTIDGASMAWRWAFSCCGHRAADAPTAIEMTALHDELSFFHSPESFTMARVEAEAYTYNPDAILKPVAPAFEQVATTNYGLMLGDTTRPPKNLLEASSRRVAAHLRERLDAAQATATASASAICTAFTEAYTAALREGDTKWASAPAVSALFHPEAKLVTHDKQTHNGVAAILRRLNKGVENLLAMADERSDATTADDVAEHVSVSTAREVSHGVWSVSYSAKWGLRQFRFEDTFTLDGDKIKKLKRSRV